MFIILITNGHTDIDLRGNHEPLLAPRTSVPCVLVSSSARRPHPGKFKMIAKIELRDEITPVKRDSYRGKELRAGRRGEGGEEIGGSL